MSVSVPDLRKFSLQFVLCIKDGLRSTEICHADVSSQDVKPSETPQEMKLEFPNGAGTLMVEVVYPVAALQKLRSLDAATATEEPTPAAATVPAVVVTTASGNEMEVVPVNNSSSSNNNNNNNVDDNVAGIIKLTVVEAKGLVSKKKTISPFVTIESVSGDLGKTLKTKPCKHSFDPVWDESFSFEVPYSGWECSLSVWDADLFRSDCIGEAKLSSTETTGDVWVPLTTSGQLHLKFQMSKKADVSPRKAVPASPARVVLTPVKKVMDRIGVTSAPGSDVSEAIVTLRIIEGEHLKTGDVYAVIDQTSGLKGEKLQTTIFQNSNAPMWNETFMFKVDNVDSWVQRIVLYESGGGGLGSSGREIGVVVLNGGRATFEEDWVPVSGGSGRLKLAYTVKPITGREKKMSLASALAVRGGEQKGPGKVTLLIFEGDNLTVCDDKTMTSDAYVRIDAVEGGDMRRKMKTKVVKKSVYPRWDEDFVLEVTDVAKWTVKCSIWHKTFTSEKPMGTFIVNGSGLSQARVRLPILDGKGHIFVGYTVLSDEAYAAEKAIMPNTSRWHFKQEEHGEDAGYVRLFLYSADNLMAKDAGGTSDPFAVVLGVRDLDGKECKTEVQKQTLSPSWNESFIFAVPNRNRWAVRVQIFDWDLLGRDKLGYVDIVGTAESQSMLKMQVMEGSGTLSVGWSISRDIPSADEEMETKVFMPSNRQGRLRVHVKSIENLIKPCSSFVQLVDGAAGSDKTEVAVGTNNPEFGQWLEIDTPDLGTWTLVLNVLEQFADGQTASLGSVSLRADKFNIGGAVDYKTIPLTNGQGEMEVGVGPAKGFKKLASQVQRAKNALQAEEMRRARLRGKTVMQTITAAGVNETDIHVRFVGITGLPAKINSVYATVSGLVTVQKEEGKTKVYRVGDAAWDEMVLRVPDLANLSFEIALWDAGGGGFKLGKIFQKETSIGRCGVGALDLDMTKLEEGVPFNIKMQNDVVLNLVLSGSSKAVEIAKRLVEESNAAAAAPAAWPELRAGMIRLHVKAGHGLLAADVGGTSDPYAAIIGAFDANGSEIRTAIIYKTLNPVWEQWFNIPVADLASFEYTLGIWDHDVAFDDNLGYVSLRAEDCDFAEGEVLRTLTVFDGSGTIEVGLAPTVHSRNVLRQIKKAKQAGLAPASVTGISKVVRARNSGVLRLRIIAATNLAGKDRGGTSSDPYCMVPKSDLMDTRGRPIKTRVINKNLSPEWNEEFEFWVADVTNFEFQISIWDWDLGKHDDLGVVTVRSKDMHLYMETGKEDKWFVVEDGEGQLHIQIETTVAAQRVFERIVKEREEREEVERKEKEAADRRARVLQMCKDRIRELREMVPLYTRKPGSDPMTIVLIVLALMFLLDLGYRAYSNIGVVVDGAVAVWDSFWIVYAWIVGWIKAAVALVWK